ncbi:MAG: HAD family phosphatase [Sphingobacteriales bacterium]|nr:MAG: HAD family phosphatase [Sphingobacteriales bacterium]
MKPTAFLFDMNGTMINDMHHHEKAWFDILNEDLKTNMTMAQVKSHMYGKNEELFERVFGKDFYTADEVAAYSLKKEQRYQKDFLPHLKWIEGLDQFLFTAREHHIKMAIGTAASPFNVDYVLDNIPVKSYFDAIITADDVPVSKPNPDVFLRCADDLGVAYENCIVFEDSPKGVEAAQRAGMKAVVIKSYHEEEEFAQLSNVLFFVDDYTDERLNVLFE